MVHRVDFFFFNLNTGHAGYFHPLGQEQSDGLTCAFVYTRACLEDDPGAASFLLEHNCDSGISGLPTAATPLHQACYSGSLECVKLLLQVRPTQ